MPDEVIAIVIKTLRPGLQTPAHLDVGLTALSLTQHLPHEYVGLRKASVPTLLKFDLNRPHKRTWCTDSNAAAGIQV